MLIKRTEKQIDEKIIKKTETMQIEDLPSKPKVDIESCCYVHGNFDWMLTFTAPNITEAKKFSDALISQFHEYIKNIELLETLYFTKRHYILNPDGKMPSDFL